MNINKYEVVITKDTGSRSMQSAVGENMSPEQAIEYVTSKRSKREREAIACGDWTVEILYADVNNR